MKAIKWLMAILLLVAVIIGAVVFVGLQNIDGIVKAVVEEAGTEVTGSQVRLQSASIQLREGRAELAGLSIANPRGFSNAKLLDVQKIAVDVEPASLAKEVKVIDEVLLSGITILAEQKNLAETNIQALLDNIQANTAGSGSASQPEAATEESAGQTLLAVKRFVFEKSRVKLVTAEWGDTELELPPITLTNLGSAEQGLTPEQLGDRVATPVMQQVKRHVAKQLEQLARDKAEEKAREAVQKKLDEKLSDKEKETLNQLKGLFGK